MAAPSPRVVMTAHRFFPHIGGTEAYVAQLGGRLAGLGWDVHVATSQEPGTAGRDRHGGVSVRRFPVRHVGPWRLPVRPFVDFVAGPGWDVVHLHGQRVWCSDHVFRHLDPARAPAVFTPHGLYQWTMKRSPVDWYYYRRHLPRRLARVARVICHTEGELRDLASFGVPQEKLVRIPPGFDAAEFARPRTGFRARHGFGEERIVLYVGGFYANKRVDRLVGAVAASGTRARLVVIGKDAQGRAGARACTAAARRHGVAFSYLGTLEREEVLAAFFEADVFALGSDFEGYGLVLLEAMAAGLPFVTTPAGAGPELAAEGAGLVGRDTAEFGAHLRRLLEDDALRRRMGAAARAAARRHDWDVSARAHAALYRALDAGEDAT